MGIGNRIEDWLSERVSVEDAEKNFTPTAQQIASNPKLPNRAFSFQNQKWERLKSHMIEGDELWYYCSPPESWEALAGRSGIALVRNGAVIETIVLLMN
jgi:hypothetical protein